jgi:hypothetical protein
LNLGELGSLLISLGVGGALGAAAATLIAGARLSSAWTGFSVAFRAFMHGRSDPESQSLMNAYGEFESSLTGLQAALAKLRRALRLK